MTVSCVRSPVHQQVGRLARNNEVLRSTACQSTLSCVWSRGGFSHEENHMCIAPQPTMLDVVNLQRIAVSSSRHRSHRIVPGKAGGIPPMHSTSKVATTLSPASDFASECSVIPMLVVTRYCTPPSREDYSLHSGGTHGCMYGYTRYRRRSRCVSERT